MATETLEDVLRVEAAKDALRVALEPELIKRQRLALGMIAQMTALYPKALSLRLAINLIAEAALFPDRLRVAKIRERISDGSV